MFNMANEAILYMLPTRKLTPRTCAGRLVVSSVDRRRMRVRGKGNSGWSAALTDKD